MWIFKKIFWMASLPFVSLTGVLMFAFPEEMKELKKDLIDTLKNPMLRWFGLALFIIATTHLVKIFDGIHTIVRLTDPNN